MNCLHIKNEFPDFLIGDLDEEAKNRIQAHIAVCRACRTELEGLSAIWTKLGVLPEERPSPALRKRFYNMLENQKNKIGDSAPEIRIRQRLRTWLSSFPAARPAFQFSMSLIILLIGMAAGSIFTSRTGRATEIARLQQEIGDVKQALAVSLLEKSSAVDRLQGVNLSNDLEKPDSRLLEALIEKVNTDPNVNIRLAAVDSLYIFYDNPIITEGIATMLANQTSPLVQVALIDLVVSMRERRAVESLKDLIKSENIDPDVRQYAELGLKQIGM